MAIILCDEGNAIYSGLFTGTIVTPGERKQSISKRTGRYSEYVEASVMFRRKDFDGDNSCYITLRVYSQKNADLVLQLRKGTQVFGIVSVTEQRYWQWQKDRVCLYGNATLVIPSSDFLALILESFERKKYSYELKKYSSDPKKIDYTGNSDETGRDVDF